MRGHFQWSTVKQTLYRRYRASKGTTFIQRMIGEINKKGWKYFRIHAAGDFYSKEYVNRWITIVKGCPNTIFRTTTRRRDLRASLSKLNALPNGIVRESLDTEISKPTMGLSFAAINSITNLPNNTLYCINDCDTCGHKCWKTRKSMVFEEE